MVGLVDGSIVVESVVNGAVRMMKRGVSIFDHETEFEMECDTAQVMWHVDVDV